MSNRLIYEKSPYLLQHAENPVDWYPWCQEAFERAEREDKPVFLSIGYSTCHWCHVMERESFENDEIAEILNKYFVSIKVDREERPDIDSVYMSVCQTLTGSGGWSMSIFMTPLQKPFFAGTYFPPESERGMTGPDGEFYSAQDADSEGEEGKFYIWSYGEICKVLGRERGKQFCEYFGITKKGNFEGRNIPNLLNRRDICDNFSEEKTILYEYRKSRTKLHLDDKILTMWNCLMICAISVLYKAAGDEKYFQAAERALKFIEDNLFEDGTLYVSCRGGRSPVKGFLDDYACYMAALISMYEVTFNEEYLERAKYICKKIEEQFADEKGRGYFLCGTENGQLITKPKEVYDNALPSGNSVMAYCLVRLSQITGEGDYEEKAKKQLAYMSGEAKHYPAGCCCFLSALLLYMNPPEKRHDG